MILAGLKLGMNEKSVMAMSYSRLLFYLDVYADMNSYEGPNASGGIRDATQEDINRFLL